MYERTHEPNGKSYFTRALRLSALEAGEQRKRVTRAAYKLRKFRVFVLGRVRRLFGQRGRLALGTYRRYRLLRP